MGNYSVAAYTGCRGHRGRQKQSLACSYTVPGGDIVYLLDLVGISGEADTKGIANPHNGLALLHGIRYQPVSHITANISTGTGAVAGIDNGTAAGGGSAHVRGCYLGSFLITGRQLNDLADTKFPVLGFAGKIIQLIYSRLTGVKVQTHIVAYLKQCVALDNRVVESLKLIVRIGADGSTHKSGHYQKNCQKHTDEPFFHRLLPLTYPLWVKLFTVWIKNFFSKFHYCYDSPIILQQVSSKCKT